MVMKAKVKQNATPNTVTACGGLEFTKKDFRIVPAHEEASVQSNPDLQISVVDDKGKKVVESMPELDKEKKDLPLEDCTKADLKALAKRVGLPVGGSKTALIARMRGYAERESSKVNDQPEEIGMTRDNPQVEEVRAGVEEVGTGDTPPEGYYEALTKKQLMAAAADLKIPKGGNKTKLLERLNGYWADKPGLDDGESSGDFVVPPGFPDDVLGLSKGN